MGAEGFVIILILRKNCFSMTLYFSTFKDKKKELFEKSDIIFLADKAPLRWKFEC